MGLMGSAFQLTSASTVGTVGLPLRSLFKKPVRWCKMSQLPKTS